MKKAFQKINSDSFCLGNIYFGVKGLQPMQKVKKIDSSCYYGYI